MRNMINADALMCVDANLITPAKEDITFAAAADHSADPIKSTADLKRMSQYFIERGRLRDNMLLVVGVNFGLRVSDLLSLTFGHLINEDCTFKKTFPILEKKTANTRRTKANRYVTINKAVVEAVTLYLRSHPSSLSDYMFRSENKQDKDRNKPMNRSTAFRMLRKAAQDLELGIHVSTHTLRKTFGYHQMRMAGNNPRQLLLLQKIFGHSTEMQTLDYIGITYDEMAKAYMNLNLCGTDEYDSFSAVVEQLP